MFAIEVIAEELREVVAGLEPDTFAGRDAARLTEVCAEVERLGAAAKTLFAQRADTTNGWRHGSRAVTSEQWLADVSGCSETQARDTLKTAERIEELPATAAKLREGALSLTQASLVIKAAGGRPRRRTEAAAQRRSMTGFAPFVTAGPGGRRGDRRGRSAHASKARAARPHLARRAGDAGFVLGSDR